MVDAVRTTTLEVLRRRVSRALGDLYQVKATAVGTNTTLIDTINIPTGNESLNRRQAIFTSGALRGNQVVITDTDLVAHRLTYTPTQGSASQVGDSMDIFNRNGQGFPPIQIDDAINEAIDVAYPLYREPIVTTAVFSAATGYVVIPNTMDEVSQIEWYDTYTGEYRPIFAAPYRTYYGWQPEVTNGRISFRADLARQIDGATLTIIGDGRPASLSLYSDQTKLDPEYVVPMAAYILCQSGLSAGHDPDGIRARLLLKFQQEAEAKKGAIRRVRTPGSVRTRG